MKELTTRQTILYSILALTLLPVITFLLVFIYFLLFDNSSEELSRDQLSRDQLIKTQFSNWDGSHYNLVKKIKKYMNDPDSYEHDETVYWDKGDHLVVKMTYRGKNAFGGTVRNFVKAKVSLNGQILEIIDQT